MTLDEIVPKLRKYITLFSAAFERGVALSGKEKNLPHIIALFPEVAMEVENLYYLFLPVAVQIEKDEIRKGVIAFEISDTRLRIESIPFDPQRLKSVIEGDRAKEFLLEVLKASHEIYDADYSIYKSGDKRLLVVENDMLVQYITYDELEEELYGVIIGVIELYKRLKAKGFEPKLSEREVEKIKEEIDRLPFFG